MFFKVLPGRLLVFILMVVCFCLPHPVNAATQFSTSTATTPAVPISESNAVSKKGLFQNIEGLCLYEVVDGQRRKIHFSRRDIESGKTLVSKGYISGVELISSSPKLAASLEDLRMECQVQGPGIEGDAGRETGAQERLGPHQYTYAYFPGVLGDIVSPKDQFCLSIHDGNARQALTIRQNGYQCLPQAVQTPLEPQYKAPVFRYAGSDLNRFLADLNDSEERFQAIKSGIRRVESAFGLKLVDFVNILPYKGPDNALTLRGKTQVWFYADAIRAQHVSELRSMAEHETLHILVDRMGYTRKTPLKELFSDLMGYGLFSRERFLLVTTGALPDASLPAQSAAKPFFAFINEKNFIPGMSGGHARDSLDEFSASFLHSLLYLDHLEKNLSKSQLTMADGTRLPITAQVRRTLLMDYLRTLAVFMKESSGRRSPLSSSTRDFFEKCMATASRVRPELVNAAF
jgi:hypothetical protein